MHLKGDLDLVKGELDWTVSLTPVELRIVISALRGTLIDEKEHKDEALRMADTLAADKHKLTQQLFEEVEKQYSLVKSTLSSI